MKYVKFLIYLTVASLFVVSCSQSKVTDVPVDTEVVDSVLKVLNENYTIDVFENLSKWERPTHHDYQKFNSWIISAANVDEVYAMVSMSLDSIYVNKNSDDRSRMSSEGSYAAIGYTKGGDKLSISFFLRQQEKNVHIIVVQKGFTFN